MLTIDRAHLLSLAEIGARASNPRSPVPAFAYTLLTMGADGLSLRACDGQREVRSRCEWAMGPKDFAACVPARELLEFARALPEGRCTLALSDGKVSLSGSGRSFDAPRSDPAFFTAPWVLPPIEGALEIDAAELCRMLAQVSWAAGEALDHAWKQSVRIERGDGSLRAWATNGKRCACADVKASGDGRVWHLPATTATALLALEPTGLVRVAGDASKTRVEYCNTTITSLRSEDWPNNPLSGLSARGDPAIVSRAALLVEAKALALASDMIRATVSAGNLELEAVGPQCRGAARLPIIEGHTDRVTFSARTLISAVSRWTTEEVALSLEPDGFPRLHMRPHPPQGGTHAAQGIFTDSDSGPPPSPG